MAQSVCGMTFGCLILLSALNFLIYAVCRSETFIVAECYHTDTASWNLLSPRRMNVAVRAEFADLQRCLYLVVLNSTIADEILWSIGSKGQFSVRSTYDAISYFPSDSESQPIFKYIWEHNLPPKISFFLWTVAHNRFPTRDMLRRRGMEVSPNCLLCSHHESAKHLILHCDFARKIWSHFKNKLNWNFVMPDDLFSWELYLQNSQHLQIWHMIVIAIFWCI